MIRGGGGGGGDGGRGQVVVYLVTVNTCIFPLQAVLWG